MKHDKAIVAARVKEPLTNWRERKQISCRNSAGAICGSGPNREASSMSVRKFGAGQSVKRVEDVRLVTGQGRYASDACDGSTLKRGLPAQPLWPRAVLDRRSRRGARHARRACDLYGQGFRGPRRPALPGADAQFRRLADAAEALSRHAARARRITSATSSRWSSPRARLRPATPLEAIAVDWEALPAVVDMEEAVRPGAPLAVRRRARQCRL